MCGTGEGKQVLYGLWRDRAEAAVRRLVSTYDCFDADEKNDLVSEIRDRFVAKYHTLREKDSLSSWVWRIAQRHCATRWRQKKRQLSTDDEDAAPLKDTGVAHDRAYHQGRLQGVVDEEMANLKTGQSAVVRMVVLEGELQTEVAKRLGISPSAVHRRLYRGLKMLKSSLLRRALHDTALAHDLRRWLEGESL